MQSVTVGMICMRDVYIQKSSFPTIAGGAKKIDSSPAKEEKTPGEKLATTNIWRVKRVLTGRPEEIEML